MQAAGLSGHLPLFWADVENSSWVGGTADTGLHERTPYWLNGFVPLAFQLDDPNLISMVSNYTYNHMLAMHGSRFTNIYLIFWLIKQRMAGWGQTISKMATHTGQNIQCCLHYASTMKQHKMSPSSQLCIVS